MAVSYTLDNYIVPSVVRLSKLPVVANVTYSSTDIAALADGEISTAILKTILSVREGFYLRPIDLTVDADGRTPIPARTIGGRINKVFGLSGNVLLPLARIEASDLETTSTPPTNTYAFYIEGNDIVSTPAAAFPLRVYYYLRPSSLTSSTNCAQITSIVGNVVTVSSAPSAWTTGTLLDLTQDQPPFGLLSFDQTAVSIVGTTLTFTTLPSELAVGDWIAPAGQTPVAQLPLEYLPVLCQRVTVRVLEIQGHLQRMQAAQAKLSEMERDLLSIINPRVEENPKKITPDRNVVSPTGSGVNPWITLSGSR